MIVPTEPELGEQKQCSRCRDWWPADGFFFYPDKRKKDGLHSWCKACFRDSYGRRYRERKMTAEVREYKREKYREYYADPVRRARILESNQRGRRKPHRFVPRMILTNCARCGRARANLVHVS